MPFQEFTIDSKTDSKRFDSLLDKGLFPSAVIKKIEADKRLGIGIKQEGDTDWNLTIIKITTIGLGLLVSYFMIKTIVSPTPTSSPTASSTMGLRTIDDLSGIDIKALTICRQNGLM